MTNNYKVKRAKKKDERTEKFGKYNNKSIRVKQEADRKKSKTRSR